MHDFLALYVIISQKISKICDSKSFKKEKKNLEFPENGRNFYACILNFLKILFSGIEFCEESVFLVLNFVKSLFFGNEFCKESVFVEMDFYRD